MALLGASFANPYLIDAKVGVTANPYETATPATGIGSGGLSPSMADFAALGESLIKPSQFTMPEMKQVDKVWLNPTSKQVYVNGLTFDADDASSALQSEQYLAGPAQGAPEGAGWTPISESSYGQYLNSIRNPSLGRLASKNFGIGVDNMQLLAGRGLQLLGAEQTGQAIVDQQARDIQKSAPFVREFSNIDSGGDAVDWFVANLAQQGPNLLESIAVGVAGFGAGTAVGGPLAGLSAGVAGILGKAATKQAILAAAKKKAAGEVLNAAENKILRTAAGTAGAVAASYGSNIATGAADIYGEMREQGVTADDDGARLSALAGSLPYAALESLSEFVLASRLFGGIKGTGRDLASIKGKTALGTGVKRSGELLKRFGVGAAVGGTLEGTTEAGQEGIVLGLSGQDLTSPESQKRFLESFAAGFGVGGTLGGIANLRRGKTPVGDTPINLLNREQPAELSTALTVVPQSETGVPTGNVTTGGMMGRPEFITGPDGTTRASRPSDTIYVGGAAPGQFGQQGVLDIFGPEGATVAELQQRSTLENPIGIPYLGEQPANIPGQGQLQFSAPAPAPTPVNTPATQMQQAMQQAEIARAIEQQQLLQEQQRQADLDRLSIVASNQRQLDLIQPELAPAPAPSLPMRQTRAPDPQQLQLFGRGQAPKPSMRERVRLGIPAPQQEAPITSAPKVDLRRGKQTSLFTQEGEPTIAALRSAGAKSPVRSIPEVGGSQIPPTGQTVTPTTIAAAVAKKGTAAKLKAKEKKNAVQEPSTTQVDVRKQSGTSEGVRKQDAKLRKTTGEGKKTTQEEQGTSVQDVTSAVPEQVTTWDRQNRSGRNEEWQAGAAESNPAFRAVDADFIPAHGMAKVSTLTQAYNDLVNLLTNGIDPNRTLFTAGLTAQAGVGAATGTAGGYAYRDGPFILTFRQGTKGQPTLADLIGVLVNPANSELVSILQEQFPNIMVRDYNNVADIVDNSKLPTPPTTPKPTGKDVLKKKTTVETTKATGKDTLKRKPKIVNVRRVTGGNVAPEKVRDIGFHFGTATQVADIKKSITNPREVQVDIDTSNLLRLSEPEFGGWANPVSVLAVLDAANITVPDAVRNFVNGIAVSDKPIMRGKEIPTAQRAALDALAKAVESKGYAGIVYENKFEGNKTEDSYILFNMPSDTKPVAQVSVSEVPKTGLAALVAQVTAPPQPKEKKSGEVSETTLDSQQILEDAIETVETTKSAVRYADAMREIVDVYVTETNQATKLFKTANEFLFGTESIPVTEFVKALQSFALTMPRINPRSRLYKLLNDYNLLDDSAIKLRVSTKKDEEDVTTGAKVDETPEEIDRVAVQLANLINNRDGEFDRKALARKAEALYKQVEDTSFAVGSRGSIEDFFNNGKPIVVQKPGTNFYVLSSVEEAKLSREEFAKAHAAARKELRDLELEAAEEDQRTALELKFQQESGIREDDNMLGGLANYYRADEKPSQPMKAGALRLLANKFISKLSRKPKLHVFQNLEDMRRTNPKLFREAAAARQAGDFEAVNAAGMAWGNTVVLFADNINGEQHANFVMAHEILGHVGFRGLFSDTELNKILQTIADSDIQVNNAATILSEAQNIPFLEAVEEVLSDRAAAIDSSTMMRFWTWMKNQLNKLGFKFNDDAARYLVSLSRKYVRQGVGRSEVNVKTLLQEAATMRELERSDVEVLRFAQLAPQGQQTAAMNAMNQNVTSTGGLEGILNWLNNSDTKTADLRRKYDGTKINTKDTMKNFFGLLRTQDDMARDSKGSALIFGLTQRKGEMQQKLKTKYAKLTQLAHEAKFMMFGTGPEPLESQQAGQLLALGSLAKANQFTDSQLQDRFEAPIAYSTDLGQIIINSDAFESLSKAGTMTVEDFKKGFDVQLGFTEKPMTPEHKTKLETDRDQEVALIEARKKRDLERIQRKIADTTDTKIKTSLQDTYNKAEDKFDAMLRSTKANYKTQIDSPTYNAPNYVNTKDMAEYAWTKDMTKDSIQYKMYLQFREAINESQMDVLTAKYAGAMYEQESILNRGIDRAFTKSLTEAERRLVTAVSDEYDRIALKDSSYENNRFKINEVSQADAVDFVEKRFARSFYNDNALNDFASTLPNYTPDEVKALVNSMRRKLRVKINPTEDPASKSSIWDLAYSMEERSTFTISLNDDSLYAKRSIAGGYAPLSRRGKFQVRVQAYTIDSNGNEEPVKLHQGQQDSLPLFMTEKKDESIGYAEELNGLLTGQYSMRDANNRVSPVYLKALVSDVETTPALVDIMHYDDVMYALSRLGVQMPVADREILIKKVTAQNSRARSNLQRGGVPGWDKDVVRSSSAFLEQQAYVAANKTFRHQFDGVLENNRNWFGDRDKLAELKAKWEAATGPAKELAAREYYQEKYYFGKANEKVGDTNVLRANFYKERAKSQLDWQDSTGDVVFADDFWNNNQFSLSARTWAAVSQLGGSIATGITQMLSLPTNSWAYLSGYNPENNFGLGLGAGRAGALLTKFAVSAANPKYISIDFLDAQLAELARTGANESKDGLTANELRFLKDLTEEQRLDAAQFNALTGTVRGRKSLMGNPTFQKFVQTWMFPFSYSEQFNRRVTVLAAYRGEYERQIAAGKDIEEADINARNAADKALDATQGDYSQYNRPAFFRGGLMSFVYMYKQYPIIMLQLFKNMDRKGQIIMLGSLILLSGLRGLPGADDILDMIDGLMQRLGLQFASVEKEFTRLTRDALGPELGAALTPVMMRGLLDATTGWSFSNHLGLGDIVPGTALFKPSASAQEKLREVENLAGAPTSFMLGVFDWASGTVPAVITGRQPLSKILTDAPVRALKNASEAWKYASTGAILDSKGYVVSQDAAAWEILGKAIGFYPSRAQVQMDWMMADDQEERYGQMIRSEAIREAVAARLNGDNDRLASVQEYVRDWNTDVKGTRLEIRNFTGGVSKAYREAAKPLAARALKSSARSGRQEAEELAALYGFEVR
jgi:hypothetical protein